LNYAFARALVFEWDAHLVVDLPSAIRIDKALSAGFQTH